MKLQQLSGSLLSSSCLLSSFSHIRIANLIFNHLTATIEYLHIYKYAIVINCSYLDKLHANVHKLFLITHTNLRAIQLLHLQTQMSNEARLHYCIYRYIYIHIYISAFFSLIYKKKTGRYNVGSDYSVRMQRIHSLPPTMSFMYIIDFGDS